MRNRLRLYVAASIILFGWLILPGAAPGQTQASKISAAAFELRMRILEGIREGVPAPAKPVTASFLKFLEFSNFEAEEDIAVEQQLRKAFNLKDARLLTETRLAWEKGKTERAFHMFRLNGHEYLVIVTPGRLAVPNQYRIEVIEQSGDKKTSLLDTEFSLPHTSAAVFGFEDTQLKPYFIFLRGVRWSGETAATLGAVRGSVTGGVSGKPSVKPPKLVREVKPVYPEEAAKAGLEGVVIIEATTDTYGRVAAAKVLRGVTGLDQAALDAVKQWVYEPMIIDGVPKPVVFTVTVQFKADKKAKPEVATASGVAVGVEGGVVGGVAGGAEAVVLKAAEKFAEGAVKIEKDVRPPRYVKHVAPVYPEIARQSAVEGTVILSVRTGPDGKVENIMVLRSVPLLDQAAIDAVRQWVYEPVVVDGKAVPAVFTQTVRFQLK